jgi:hypothetical protein
MYVQFKEKTADIINSVLNEGNEDELESRILIAHHYFS